MWQPKNKDAYLEALFSFQIRALCLIVINLGLRASQVYWVNNPEIMFLIANALIPIMVAWIMISYKCSINCFKEFIVLTQEIYKRLTGNK